MSGGAVQLLCTALLELGYGSILPRKWGIMFLAVKLVDSALVPGAGPGSG